jgi:hypothetical protein
LPQKEQLRFPWLVSRLEELTACVPLA